MRARGPHILVAGSERFQAQVGYPYPQRTESDEGDDGQRQRRCSGGDVRVVLVGDDDARECRGSAAATTSILRLSGSILNSRPSISITAGMKTILRMHPSTACQLMTTLIDDSVMPAENTASEALAPLMRLNEGWPTRATVCRPAPTPRRVWAPTPRAARGRG